MTGLTDGTTYMFEVRAQGGTHGLSNRVTATAGAAAAVPVVTGVSPAGPANNNQPVVNGVNTGLKAMVRIYGSAACDGTVMATGTSGSDGSFAISVSVADDSTAPSTTVNGGPASELTNATSVTFFLTSSEVCSTFECSLDGAVFAPCGRVAAYTVGAGSHTFWAQATDSAGNTGKAASMIWTVTSGNLSGCTIIGTEGDDVICGLGGNDIIRGGAGGDVISGGCRQRRDQRRFR